MGQSSSTNSSSRRLSSNITKPIKSIDKAQTPSRADPAERLAFTPTNLHKGLQNLTGENNCFLNVTIQALWHLGPFRVELQRLLNGDSRSKNAGELIKAICNLFTQYQFGDLSVLPPYELREVLTKLSSQFEIGKVVDSNETLDTILDRIHTESCPSCPGPPKCLSHLVFGGELIEQSFCTSCGATSEPSLRSDYVHCVYVAELLDAARDDVDRLDFAKGLPGQSSGCLQQHSFGKLLQKCLTVGQRTCPSLEEGQSRSQSLTRPPPCTSKANVRLYCLEAPLALALSVGWTAARESQETIRDFLGLVSYSISLSELFVSQESSSSSSSSSSGAGQDDGSTSAGAWKKGPRVPTGPSYAFRGFVCYYGMHYVSIFQAYDGPTSEPQFLLFDDHKIRPLGGWEDVKAECCKAMYQPVLLLYELTKEGVGAGGDPMQWSDLYRSAPQGGGGGGGPSAPSSSSLSLAKVSQESRGSQESPKDGEKGSPPPSTRNPLYNHVLESAQPKPVKPPSSMSSKAVKGVDDSDCVRVRLRDRDDDDYIDINSADFDDAALAPSPKEAKASTLSSSSSSTSKAVQRNDARDMQGSDRDGPDGVDAAAAEDAWQLQWAALNQARAAIEAEEQRQKQLRQEKAPNQKHIDARTQSSQSLPFTPPSSSSSSSSSNAGRAASAPPERGQQEVSVWGRRPVRTTVHLHPVLLDAKRVLGLQPEIDMHGRVIVTDFYRHPETNAMLPAEKCGKINFMDRIVHIDDTAIQPGQFKSAQEFSAAMSKASSPISLTVESHFETYMWFECPYCQAEIAVDEDLERMLVVAGGSRVRVDCTQCGYSSWARDVIPGDTM